MPCLKIIVRLSSGVIRKLIDSTGAKRTSDANEDGPVTKRAKRQVAVEEVKKELVEKHANKFSEPQYKLWALMVINGQWTNKSSKYSTVWL